jgi:hypothetical protein
MQSRHKMQKRNTPTAHEFTSLNAINVPSFPRVSPVIIFHRRRPRMWHGISPSTRLVLTIHQSSLCSVSIPRRHRFASRRRRRRQRIMQMTNQPCRFFIIICSLWTHTGRRRAPLHRHPAPGSHSRHPSHIRRRLHWRRRYGGRPGRRQVSKRVDVKVGRGRRTGLGVVACGGTSRVATAGAPDGAGARACEE